MCSCVSPIEAEGMKTGENIDCTEVEVKQAEEFPTKGNAYLYKVGYLLGEVGTGVSKISNTRSVTAPLNLILV